MGDMNLITEDAVPSSSMRSASLLQTSSSHTSTSPSTRPSSPATATSPALGLQQDTPSIQIALESLRLSSSEQEGMFRSLATIFRNAQEQEGSVSLDSGGAEAVWTSLQRADASSRHGLQDTPALRVTRDILEQMLWNQSRLLVDAAKILADTSRDGRAAHETNDFFYDVTDKRQLYGMIRSATPA